MKTVLSILLFPSIWLCASMVVAQDFLSFREKAEKMVKSKNPSLKLIRKQERQKEVTYLWGLEEKADVVLTIF